MFCNNCGQAIEDYAQKCMHCGAPVINAPQRPVNQYANQQNVNVGAQRTKNNKGTTAFLGIVAGTLVLVVVFLLIALGVMSFIDKDSETDETTTAQTTAVTKEFPDGEAVYLNNDLQYNVNIFLSNFSESGLESFIDTPSDEQLIDFSLSYNMINRYYLYEELMNPVNDPDLDWANVRIEEKYVLDSIKKFFGIERPMGFAQEHKLYKDGYLYNQFTGGYMLKGLTIVKELEYLGNNRYKAEFEIYEDLNGDNQYYSYSYSEIQKVTDEYLHKEGYGTAVFYAGNINSRDTYHLEEYVVTRD